MNPSIDFKKKRGRFNKASVMLLKLNKLIYNTDFVSRVFINNYLLRTQIPLSFDYCKKFEFNVTQIHKMQILYFL